MQAVAETITIVLEHFIGDELERATFTVFTDVTDFSFGSRTQRTALFSRSSNSVENARGAKNRPFFKNLY